MLKDISIGISVLIGAFFALRKFFKWLRPIHVEASAKGFSDNSNPDEICAKIINRSSEHQYISECNARGTYSLGYKLKRHLRNPLLRPKLYPNIWYGGVVYNLMESEAVDFQII